MDELRAGAPVVVGGVTLVPVERCTLEHGVGDAGCWLYGRKEPWAVVVRDAGRMLAFDASGRRIPLEVLARKVPGIRALLESILA